MLGKCVGIVCVTDLLVVFPNNNSSPLAIVPPSTQSGEEHPSEGTTTASPVQKCREVLPAGVLAVEPYCWKDVVLKPPLLSITTTASQTAILSLPPG